MAELRRALYTAILAALGSLSPVAADTLEIAIVRPLAAASVWGETEVLVSVSSLEAVRRVELFVDGRYAGFLQAPPYRWTVDVGQENTSHRFEALAEDVAGRRAHATLVTPALGVDEEIDVSLQQIYVTATREGRPVDDLDRSDFSIFDQGELQKVVTFERGDVPLTALLALDASHSMRGRRLAVALSAVRSFFARMRPLDQASLLLFADDILYSSPFTGFQAVLGTGLDRVRARGGTALSDHLYVALKRLERQQGRRVLMVLTDGFDTTSALRMTDVAWAAQRSQAMIYWLRLRDPSRALSFTSTWHDNADYRAELAGLERIARQSGGDVLLLADTDRAQAAFDGILQELRGQYVLGYYPDSPVGNDSWREVRIRLARRGVKLRYRDGYLAD